ncbi:hypothetical protein MTBBW1_420021 [Desulfamplus magnetovallimortis]|uniref:PIN domain-containing protein n=1 Tax=Desulfamplus magnetovallimortis TaxID=1246637 RepID=A0A1W1HH34_9BACT|nr:type II toxin-antitoxin system VapC family toxin [Desulfamplus magnetovallimortis]SLM31756.1 hypothetical protein MTBBW1_420021 [Desulfamplus magnetovallimortis]
MKYLFDADAISLLYHNKQRSEKISILKKLRILQDSDQLFVSVLTFFELEYSITNTSDLLKKQELRNTLEHLKYRSNFSSLPIREDMAYLYGEIKCTLKQKGKISRENIKKFNIDIMIASTALYEGCIVVSGDEIYHKISKHKPELQTECWW